MTFREFFHPTKAKIILAIIFLIFAIFGFINFGHTCPIQQRGDPPCTQPLIDQASDYASYIFGTRIGGFVVEAIQFGNTGEDVLSIILTIVGILLAFVVVFIYNFIISSIIIGIYNKLRR